MLAELRRANARSRGKQLINRKIRQCVRALISRHACVSFHPVPLNLMARDFGVESLPEVDVLHGFAIGGAPIATLPLREPFENAVAHVLRIGIERHFRRSLQCGQRLDGRSELHAIVGRQRLGAFDLALMQTRGQHGAPAAWTRIAATCAVGVDGDEGHE